MISWRRESVVITWWMRRNPWSLWNADIARSECSWKKFDLRLQRSPIWQVMFGFFSSSLPISQGLTSDSTSWTLRMLRLICPNARVMHCGVKRILKTSELRIQFLLKQLLELLWTLILLSPKVTTMLKCNMPSCFTVSAQFATSTSAKTLSSRTSSRKPILIKSSKSTRLLPLSDTWKRLIRELKLRSRRKSRWMHCWNWIQSLFSLLTQTIETHLSSFSFLSFLHSLTECQHGLASYGRQLVISWTASFHSRHLPFLR